MKRIITSIFLIIGFSTSLFASDVSDINLRKNVIIIFDDSGSMDGHNLLFKTRLNRAKIASKKLIFSLDSNYNVGLLFLNSKHLNTKLININNKNKRFLNRSFEMVHANGGTYISSNINKAILLLKKQRDKQGDNGSYSIIIVTDGKADNNKKMILNVKRAINERIIVRTIGIDIYKHELTKVSFYVKASSEKELFTALSNAVMSEVSFNGNQFIQQDF